MECIETVDQKKKGGLVALLYMLLVRRGSSSIKAPLGCESKPQQQHRPHRDLTVPAWSETP
jgi:hypothetical protein